MADCNCTNCVFVDGSRYCYDCDNRSTMLTAEELDRKIQERYLDLDCCHESEWT